MDERLRRAARELASDPIRELEFLRGALRTGELDRDDKETQERVFQAAIRAGGLSPTQLKLAAYLGDPLAIEHSGSEFAYERGGASFLEGIALYDRELAANVLLDLCLEEPEREHPHVEELLRAATIYLEEGSDFARGWLQEQTRALDRQVREMRLALSRPAHFRVASLASEIFPLVHQGRVDGRLDYDLPSPKSLGPRGLARLRAQVAYGVDRTQGPAQTMPPAPKKRRQNRRSLAPLDPSPEERSQAEALRARREAGELAASRLAVAATLGHVPAGVVLDDPGPSPRQGLHRDEFRDWDVEARARAAEVALRLIEPHWPEGLALPAFLAWSAAPQDEARQEDVQVALESFALPAPERFVQGTEERRLRIDLCGCALWALRLAASASGPQSAQAVAHVLYSVARVLAYREPGGRIRGEQDAQTFLWERVGRELIPWALAPETPAPQIQLPARGGEAWPDYSYA